MRDSVVTRASAMPAAPAHPPRLLVSARQRGCLAAILLLTVAACGGRELPAGPTVLPPALLPFEPSIEGEYRLTITASPSCSLPAKVRQRAYVATVAEPSPGHVTVTLSGADFRWGTGPFNPGFEGTRDGNALQFTIAFKGGWGVGELVDGTVELSYWGTASATIRDGDLIGTFIGEIFVNAAGDIFDPLGDCTASDHTVAFARGVAVRGES